MRQYHPRSTPRPDRDWEEALWEEEDWEEENWEDGWSREELPAPRPARRRSRPVRRQRGVSRSLVVLLAVCFALMLFLGRLLLMLGGASRTPAEDGGAVTGGNTGSGTVLEGETGDDESGQSGGFILPTEEEQKLQAILNAPDQYPQALRELAEKNPEAIDFVYQYPQLHDQTPEIDLSAEAAAGTVPLLLQWDSRWGYQSYGSGLIGYTGCGPTCLSMVALCLTGNASYDPLTVARYAQQAGYYVEGTGTSWELMSDGCAHFGLAAEELPLDEGRMASALAAGMPLICAMGPGDFTDNGHFIVVTGYDGAGFSIRDPNSPQRSARTWSFEELSGQIRNLWAFSKV